MTAQIIKRQHDEGEGVEVIFFDNNIPIGAACTVALGKHNGDVNIFLHDFKVKEQYRGKGYGTQILKYMIENFGVDTLYVNKNSEAIKLYKRFGFETVDMFNNNLVMQRKRG